jgi:hypothetical protein
VCVVLTVCIADNVLLQPRGPPQRLSSTSGDIGLKMSNPDRKRSGSDKSDSSSTSRELVGVGGTGVKRGTRLRKWLRREE